MLPYYAALVAGIVLGVACQIALKMGAEGSQTIALQPGDAWLRVAPVDRGWRQERVRVALPKPRKLSSETSLGN